MTSSRASKRRGGRRKGRGPDGSVLVMSLMAIVVLSVLATGALTVSSTEDLSARRERAVLPAFYAAEGGVHEALARLNLDPSGAGNDETEVTAGSGGAGPDSVRDPRMVQGHIPDPNPANYSDSTVSLWRFWNYDPAWRYSGTSAGGEGNYPGATAAQRANLDSAGRAFTYNGASARTLVGGSSYTVRVVPLVRNVSGTWVFCDERGNPAPNQYYYYKIVGTGSQGSHSATVEVMARKFFFGVTVPAAVTAGGGVTVGGNASVTASDPDEGSSTTAGSAVQSAGAVNVTGSGTIDGGSASSTTFPGFQSIFGTTPAEVQPMATITGTYSANTTTNPDVIDTSDPTHPRSLNGITGQLIWLTAKVGGSKKDVNLTGGGSGGFVLGSPNNPVILVVDGNLTLNSVTIYGVIYVTGSFDNQGGSQVHGAILVEGTAETDILGTGSGEGTKIAYNKRVLDRLSEDNQMFPFRIVKGTWKMSRG